MFPLACLLCLLVPAARMAPVRLPQLAVLKNYYLNTREGNVIRATQIDDNFVYVATNTWGDSNRQRTHVIQLRKGNLHRVRARTLPILLTAGAETHEMRTANATDSIFLATRAHPSRVVRMGRERLILNGSFAEPHQQAVLTMQVSEQYLYTFIDGDPPRFIKLRADGDLHTGASFELPLQGEGWPLTSVLRGDMLYAGTASTSTMPHLLQINVSGDGAPVKRNSIPLRTGSGIAALAVDDEYVYAGTQDSPAIVFKVRSRDMRIVHARVLSEGEAMVGAMAVDDTHLYVATKLPTTKIIKMSKLDLIDAAMFELPDTSDQHSLPSQSGLQHDDESLYVALTPPEAGSTKAARILKLSKTEQVHCVLTEWTPWTMCSATCGGGVQRQSRNVTLRPSSTGRQCDALSRQRACATTPCRCYNSSAWTWSTCNKATGFTTANGPGALGCLPSQTRHVCKVPCEVAEWSAWSSCDSARGTQTRTRNVTVPPLNGGSACPQLVNTTNCDVDCILTSWSELGKCGAELFGVQKKTRKVITMQQHGGLPCGHLDDFVDCAKHCEASDWGSWGPCDADKLSSSFGQSTRTRTLIGSNPNKLPCELTQSSNCALSCTVSDWKPPGSCINGSHTFTRDVISYEANGGSACPPLEKHEPCPVDCKLTHWGSWSGCSSERASEERRRLIASLPRNGGRNCTSIGATKEVRACKCDYQWASWGPCSALCDGGNKTRTGARNSGGVACPATRSESTSCGTISCSVVQCELSAWSTWSDCTHGSRGVRCGGGIQTRIRRMTRRPGVTAPACGSTLQQRTCKETPCRVACKVSAWGDWSPCDMHSHMLYTWQSRDRKIKKPSSGGGKPCPELRQTRQCAATACALSDWSAWGPCDVKNRRQQRVRFVMSPPQNGGVPCGALADFKDCVSECRGWPFGPVSACQHTGPLAGTMGRVRRKGSPPACKTKLERVMCAVDCAVTSWTSWSNCDFTTGETHRSRIITAWPQHGGARCPLLTERKRCVSPCKLSPWGRWSPCNATGFETRHRAIDEPPTPESGLQCDDLIEVRGGCKRDCELSVWSSWSGSCTPTGGAAPPRSVYRKRYVLSPPTGGGMDCDALDDFLDCDTACKSAGSWGEWSLCVVTGEEAGKSSRSRTVSGSAKAVCLEVEQTRCPVHCVVGDYGAWNACDVENGFRNRTRAIRRKSRNGGTPCPSLVDRQKCVFECKLGPWQPWSACSRSAWQTRKRAIIQAPQHGKPCGKHLERRRCAVNCELTQWSGWTPCVAGSITKQRHRAVMRASQHGGQPCAALSEQNDCPGANCTGTVTEWTAFSACSDRGTKTRSRRLLQNLTHVSCVLNENVTCAVNCKLAQWGAWVPPQCGKDSSGATILHQRRARNIVLQPLNGGARCDALVEKRQCDGLPTPSPSPEPRTPTPAPATVPGAYSTAVETRLLLAGPGAVDAIDVALRNALIETVGVAKGKVTLVRVGAEHADRVKLQVTFSVSNPADAHQKAARLEALGLDPDELVAALRRQHAPNLAVSIIGPTVEKELLREEVVRAAPAANDAGEEYTRIIKLVMRAYGYTLQSFDKQTRVVFVHTFASMLDLPASVVEVSEVRMQTATQAEHASESFVTFDLRVRCTESEAAEAMFKFQLTIKQQLSTLEQHLKKALVRGGVAMPRLRLERRSGPSEDEGVIAETTGLHDADSTISPGTGPSPQALGSGVIVAIAVSATVVLVGLFAALRTARRRRHLMKRNAYFETRTTEDDEEAHGEGDNVMMDSDWHSGPTANDWLDDDDQGNDRDGNAL